MGAKKIECQTKKSDFAFTGIQCFGTSSLNDGEKFISLPRKCAKRCNIKGVDINSIAEFQQKI